MFIKKNFILLVLAILFSCTSQNTEVANSDSNTPVKERFQAILKGEPPVEYNFERTFRKKILPVRQKQLLYNNSDLYVKNDTLIGFDWQEQQLLIYSDDLNVSKFGKNGMGPTETTGVSFYRMTSDTSYVTFDYFRSRLAEFTLQNELIRDHTFTESKVDEVQYAGGTSNRNLFVLYHINNSRYLVSYYDFKEKKILKSFDIQEIFPSIGEHYDYDLVVEGQFYMNPTNTIYSFYKAGFFLVFDGSLNKPAVYRTIDRSAFPKATKIPDGYGGFNYGVSPEYSISSNGAVSNNIFYLLSDLQHNGRKTIDTYSIASGEYLGSIDLPNLDDGQKPTIIAVSEDNQTLFVLYEDLVIVEFEVEEL